MNSEEKELIEAVKYLKKEKRSKAMGRVLGAFGKLIPKGVRNPDSLVTNRHLYLPGRKGKTVLR